MRLPKDLSSPQQRAQSDLISALYSGGAHGDANWAAHGNIVGNHQKHCFDTDQPIAGLIMDLKRRGSRDFRLSDVASRVLKKIVA